MNNIPPLNAWKRNGYGLLENVDYKFKADQSVDWRALIAPEFIVPNREVFMRRGIDVSKMTKPDVAKLVSESEDKDLLILLAGFKELASIRGVSNVLFSSSSSESFAFAQCRISFIGNYETGGQPIEFASTADAHPNNTSGFGKAFLTTISENRAFSRCVRNALKIFILGMDELGAQGSAVEEAPSTNSSTSPHGILEAMLKAKNSTFERLKNSLIVKSQAEEYKKWAVADKWTTLNDLDPRMVYEIIKMIQEKEAGAKQ